MTKDQIEFQRKLLIDQIMAIWPEQQIYFPTALPYCNSVKYLCPGGAIGYSSPEVAGQLTCHTINELPFDALVVLLEELTMRLRPKEKPLTQFDVLYAKNPLPLEAGILALEITEEASRYIAALTKSQSETAFEIRKKLIAKRLGWDVDKVNAFLDSDPKTMKIEEVAAVFLALGRRARVTSVEIPKRFS